MKLVVKESLTTSEERVAHERNVKTQFRSANLVLSSSATPPLVAPFFSSTARLHPPTKDYKPLLQKKGDFSFNNKLIPAPLALPSLCFIDHG